MKSFVEIAVGLLLPVVLGSTSNPTRYPYDLASMKKRLEVYKSHSKVLRQINSDKMEYCRSWKNFLDFSIFISTVVLTFFSFYGVDKINQQYFSHFMNVESLQLCFNLLILFVLILSAVQLAAGLGEKQVEHFGTVQRLTDFITDIDDLLIVVDMDPGEIKRNIQDINQRYKGITSSLPENSDGEWTKAKKRLAQKKAK